MFQSEVQNPPTRDTTPTLHELAEWDRLLSDDLHNERGQARLAKLFFGTIAVAGIALTTIEVREAICATIDVTGLVFGGVLAVGGIESFLKARRNFRKLEGNMHRVRQDVWRLFGSLSHFRNPPQA